MIDGTYRFEVDVPFGRKNGTVTLRTEGDAVFADIDAPVIGKQHIEGHAEGDKFKARGSGKFKFVGKVDYTLEGEVVGDKLHIRAESSKGAFEFEGVRV